MYRVSVARPLAGVCSTGAHACQRMAQVPARAMSAAAPTDQQTRRHRQRQRSAAHRPRPLPQAQAQALAQPTAANPPRAAAVAAAAAATAGPGATSGATATATAAQSVRTDGGARDPLRPFWDVANRFVPPGWMDKQRNEAPLAYEAKMRRETRTSLGAGSPSISRPQPSDLADLQRVYDEVVRRELPQFDPLAPEALPSSGEWAAARVARMHADPDAGKAPANAQIAALPFTFYTPATHALLRLTTENPPQLPAGSADREPGPASSAVAAATATTDPLYPLHLLQRYWSNIFSPVSPFDSSYTPTLHWWAMMAAIQVVLGSAVRDPPESRVALLRALLDRMRAQMLVPQPGVEGTDASLYDYSIKHEAFFRALLYAAMHTPDQSFAATLLPQVVHLAQPRRETHAPASVVWKPLPRFVQGLLFDQFMANCCAHIFVQQHQQPSETDGAAAAVPSQPLVLSHRLRAELMRSTLLGQFSDMQDTLDLVALEHRQWGQLDAAPAAASPPSSSSGASAQDIMFHSFRLLSSTPLPLFIRHYNFLLFALTHTQQQQLQTRQRQQQAHALIAECVDTILREEAVQFDLATVHILLHYCLRDYTGTGTSGSDIGADRVSLLQVVLTQMRRLLLAQPADGPHADLSPQAAQMLAHASHAQMRHTNPRATSEQLADALVRFHSAWAPLLRSSAALASWNRAVVSHLAALGSWTPLRLFLTVHGADLTADDMRAVMECCSDPEVFQRADQWAHSSAAETSQATSDPSAGEVIGADASASSGVAASSASAAPAAAPSMSVSPTILRWEEAKASLSPSRRQWLRLPSLEPAAGADGDATASHSKYVAREMEAAKYIVYHSRKLHLEKGAGIDSPLGLPSLYAAPLLDLPAAVLSAPNFSTGWLLMCSAWVQHQGEQQAIQSIKRVLSLVALAASGSGKWITEMEMANATASTAAAAPAAPTSSPPPPATSQASASSSSSGSSNPLVRSVLGWLNSASKSLVSDISTSVHVFTPAPTKQPLLATRQRFSLHPQLLHSILYSFQFFPHYRHNTTEWLALFKQLEPHVSLFNLRNQNPMLVKLFQCVDQSGPFFDLLRASPWRTWPSLMADLARVWDPVDAHMQARGRLLLLFLIRHTCPASGAMPAPAPAPSTGKPTPPPVLIRPAHLVECVRPFMQRMETNGHAGEMRVWINELDRPHPQLLVQLWEYIHFCVQKNGGVVAQLHKTQPTITPEQLQAMALLPIQEAVQWRSTLRHNRRLPPTSAMLLQRAVASVTPAAASSGP